MPAGLGADRFVAPELLSYPSSDELEIPAFLYKPTDLEANGQAPLLLYSHSFGGGMFVNGFYPFVQYFVSRGYVVLAAQVRGSSGNGRRFASANQGDWGGMDIDDTVAGIEYLDDLGLIDRNRVVMQGGSTGGYRTMQTAVRFPDALKAGVNLYGPTNVVSLHEFYKGTRRRGMMMSSVGGDRGDPTQAPDHWRSRSATHNIDRIKTLLLLLWADRDLGVPTNQADEYVRLARGRRSPSSTWPERIAWLVQLASRDTERCVDACGGALREVSASGVRLSRPCRASFETDEEPVFCSRLPQRGTHVRNLDHLPIARRMRSRERRRAGGQRCERS